MKELTTKQAILARRSIRRCKPDPVPAEHLSQLPAPMAELILP